MVNSSLLQVSARRQLVANCLRRPDLDTVCNPWLSAPYCTRLFGQVELEDIQRIALLLAFLAHVRRVGRALWGLSGSSWLTALAQQVC